MTRAACPTCSCGYEKLPDKLGLPQYQIKLSEVKTVNDAGGTAAVVKFFEGKGVTVMTDAGTGKPALDGNIIGICRNVQGYTAIVFANCKGANPNDPNLEHGC